MKKLRMALSKGEELRFLSHLDYSQAVMRTLRRADVGVAYSEGFNPHMKISFSSALALGITASTEYMDIDLEEDISLEDMKRRFNENCPRGMECTAVEEKPDKVRKMMAICNFAIYEVTGKMTGEADWDALLRPINEADEIMFEKVTPKKTRMINVKDFVKEPMTATVDGDTVTIRMGIGIYPTGTMKPGELWALGRDSYGWPVTASFSVHREAILVEEADGSKMDPLVVI